MTKVDIFGTCLTRELFNVALGYEVNTYLMQQSIFTMFSEPFPIDYKMAKSHDDYKFKNRMIYYEMNKMGIYKMLENPAEYLIIDLADLGRDILEFDNPKGVKLICTEDILYTLNSLNGKEDFRYRVFDVRNFTEQEIIDMLRRFIALILEKYDSRNIILNTVQMSDIYYDNNIEKRIVDNFIYSRLCFIKRIEELFIALLPNCRILKASYEPLLDINHRLGAPHPAHFEKIYYEYRMQLLDSLIRQDSSAEEIDNNYKLVYDREIKRIRAKRL